ncbi:MAG TPA: single-stranded DNA-binding protein [Nocardioidaceae bacterium]|nr:single-stranded DNA-binding protein [Nocardioidaceae bacterium]
MSEDESTEPANEVRLAGRVTGAPAQRTLPSGDEILTFRISVPRTRTPMTARSKQSVDWVECVAWSARARRTVARWAVGEQVLVRGALRRRHYRVASGPQTRLEVEVLEARRA